jgi:pimeloyl-ACP methyl ester carboxylesterase
LRVSAAVPGVNPNCRFALSLFSITQIQTRKLVPLAPFSGFHHPQRTGPIASGLQGDLRAARRVHAGQQRLAGFDHTADQGFLSLIDYLESRAASDHNRLGFYGVSSGRLGLASLAGFRETRQSRRRYRGGLYPESLPPEVDTLNFVPRVTIPFLMINGRYDFDTPLNTCQLPMFRLLGTPLNDKRHALFDVGHLPEGNDIIKETLDWYAHYLRPVKSPS